jgi:Family of unknown function (DUF6519)
VFAVREFIDPRSVRIAARPDISSSLAVGDWVEVSGERSELAGAVGTLACVTEVRGDGIVLDRDLSRHTNEPRPRVRRWDQRSSAVLPVSTGWAELEAGIEVRFSHGDYRSGDYWTMPARPATGPIEWPTDRPPDGIDHRFAPLALITWERAKDTWRPKVRDCRRLFTPLTQIHKELARLRLELEELRSTSSSSRAPGNFSK